MTNVAMLFASLAFVGGLLVAAQGPIYARLSQGLHHDHLAAAFFAFLVAALVTGVLAFFAGSFESLSVSRLFQLPPWVWLGGLFGATHVVITMQSIPVLGVSLFLVIVVTGNLVGASIYDHLGAMDLDVRPFTPTKAVGLLLVVVGVAVFASSK